jgi:hypothetical protein
MLDVDSRISCCELDDAIDDDEDFRVLGFEKNIALTSQLRLKEESVCSGVSSV